MGALQSLRFCSIIAFFIAFILIEIKWASIIFSLYSNGKVLYGELFLTLILRGLQIFDEFFDLRIFFLKNSLGEALPFGTFIQLLLQL